MEALRSVEGVLRTSLNQLDFHALFLTDRDDKTDTKSVDWPDEAVLDAEQRKNIGGATRGDIQNLRASSASFLLPSGTVVHEYAVIWHATIVK